jgi:lysophospholipase L1-like esterase
MEKKRFFNLFNIITVLLFSSAAAYIYAGFYYPDPTVFAVTWMPELILLAIRILFPLFAAGIVLLYYSLYTKKIKAGPVILMVFALFFILLLIYPAADYMYGRAISKNINEFNAYLQLNPQMHSGIDHNNFNIFCLGGSTTEFKDERGRDWPGMLEKELRKKFNNQNIKVYNFGKQWYTTQHILINYTQNLRKYKPDMIIVMENINDLLHNADFSIFANGSFREDYGSFMGPITRMIKHKSFAEHLVFMIRHLWYSDKFEEVNTSSFPGLVSFRRNISTIAQLARIDSIPLVLMTQPNIYKESMSREELAQLEMLNMEAAGNGKRWTYNTALHGLQQYNEKIIEVASAENVKLIDLEKKIPKQTKYFYDDVHYKSEAYDLIAKVLSDEIELDLSNNIHHN